MEHEQLVFGVQKCRVNNASGFGALDAVKRKINAGECPIYNKYFETLIGAKPHSPEGDQEVANNLEKCVVCRLQATKFDITYESE